jgi:hypothetical protein
MADEEMSSRQFTVREELIFAYMEGFKSGKIITRELTEEQIIRKATWKANRLLHPGATLVYAGNETFPPNEIPAPPDLEKWPECLRKPHSAND